MTPPRKPSKEELDNIFGDVLPDTTADERDQSPQEPADDWYERNRPPPPDSE